MHSSYHQLSHSSTCTFHLDHALPPTDQQSTLNIYVIHLTAFCQAIAVFFWHFYAQCNVHIAKAFCLQTRSPPFHSAGEIMLSICQLVCSIVFRYVLFSYSNCNSSALIILSRAGIEERKKRSMHRIALLFIAIAPMLWYITIVPLEKACCRSVGCLHLMVNNSQTIKYN